MEHVVVDSSILVSSLLQEDVLHQQARPYINGLENGDYVFHLPMLAVVEMVAAISRRAPAGWQALLVGTKMSLRDWEKEGKIELYPLDRDRMSNSSHVAQQHGLRGADSVMVALAQELNVPLKTFDKEILQKFPQASI
ncbi:MAG: type II toxin-antitoxin system VapC family toxin [SAR202 cluster bacterium]|nr:type II toxin-antitoxin system VapC family toxin [SAR202 cluster bacterium]